MYESKYQEWLKEGLIPGPLETKEQFEERALFCLSLKEGVFQKLMPKDSLVLESHVEKVILEESYKITEKEYGLAPKFLPIFFSNKGLSFWHGAALWIFQEKEEGPLGAFIQLRKSFYERNQFLFFYKRDEVIAHEMVHAARMAFQEPKYEEVLAYKTTSGLISKYIGPIISSSFQSRFFMILLAAIIMLDVSALYFGSIELYESTLLVKWGLLALVLMVFIKLLIKQKRVANVDDKLKKLYGSQGKTSLLFLTDKEIDNFSKMEAEEILEYVEKASSFRLKVFNLYGVK